MNHRIRVATIIINNQKILLVKHVHPETGYAWWVPPGGGLEDKDASIFDCAKREVFEETIIVRDLKSGLQETIPITKVVDEIKKRLK